jgi:organic radical activating enzyme
MANLFPARTLSIMPTWQCNASCANCGTYSHPKNKNHLKSEDVFSAIKKAKEDDIQIVVFTGGEATLKLPDLLRYIEYSTSLGIATRLVSNCWWAKTISLADKTLSQLKIAGLHEINFSTGDEHTKFVSLNTVANAVIKSVEYGFHPYVMIELTEGARVTKEHLTQALEIKNFSKHDHLTFIESPWTPVDPFTTEKYDKKLYANKSNSANRGGCDSLFTTPTLQANGALAACCGIGMQQIDSLHMGSYHPEMPSFNTQCAKAEQDIFKLLVKHFGPEHTIAMAAEFNGSILWENMYAHKCQACIRLFSDEAIKNEILSREDYFWSKLASSLAVDRLVSQQMNRSF